MPQVPAVIPLSVLDLATVASGSTPAQALRDTTAMAVAVEQLGYRRREFGTRGIDRPPG